MKPLALIAVLLLALTTGEVPMKPMQQQNTDSLWVETTLQHLTLEEKAAQLVFTWTNAGYMEESSQQWRDLERMVTQQKIGGIVLSLGNVYDYAIQSNKLQKQAAVPLLVTGDFEWGVAMRVKQATVFPPAMALGAARDTGLARRMGNAVARELKALGVHQDFAPTVDVNTNPRNPVINTRSYSDNPALVGDLSTAVVHGLQEEGIIATVKHFPGHGQTEEDTHLRLPVLNLSPERMKNVELPPFERAIKEGVLSVMVGHISVPAYDTAEGIPATVSPRITTTLLQEQLGFKGLIVTDAMEMHGLADAFGPTQAPVLALKAGNDIVLMPVNERAAIDAIVAAVKRGELTEARLDHSVRKLLTYKAMVGLHKNRFTDVDRISAVVGSLEHRLLAMEIARKAVTVLGNGKNILPLRHRDTRQFASISFTDIEDPGVAAKHLKELHERLPNVESARIDRRSGKEDRDRAIAAAKRADVIICDFHYLIRSAEMTGFVPRDQQALVKELCGLGKPIVGIAYGNPYVAMDFPVFDSYVCAYASSDLMQDATAEVLFAESPAQGLLPVAIEGRYPYGAGITYPKAALRRGLPEEAGFSSRKLDAVDSLVYKGIRDSAYPGAVLLIARNGVIIHEKAYGKETYEPYAKLVQANNIFDLASVSKVIGTTNAIMKLVGDGRLRLDRKVAEIIPEFGQNGKENITVYNLLVHNSGLPGWKRFYLDCTTPQMLLDTLFATRLVYPTGDSTVYSDLGFITLGKVVERISGQPLDKFLDEQIFKSLSLRWTMYAPPASLTDRCIPTEVDTYWKKTGLPVRGRVHDENAATLNGVSGHAGLFSTASDLSIILQMLLNGGSYEGRQLLQTDVIKEFTRQQSPKSSRGIGWDMNEGDGRWCGSKLSKSSYIHTGFTGTSVVADPERNLIIIFLTNRVYPTRDNGGLGRLRPRLHDAIVNALQ